MYKFIFFILVSSIWNFSYSQKANPKKKSNQVIENSEKEYKEYVENLLNPKQEKETKQFLVDLKLTMDSNSKYYNKNIEKSLINLDSTLNFDQIISFTKFKIFDGLKYDLLDTLCLKAYRLNEEEKYKEAISICKKILQESPNNITGHKEIALAYKKLGDSKLSNLHFTMMKKIILAVKNYNQGIYEDPYIVNNFFEGFSIAEVASDANQLGLHLNW